MSEIKIHEADVPIERKDAKRILGQDAGSVVIAEDFDAPVDPETMR